MKKFTLLFAMLIGIFSSAWADEVAIDRSGWTVAAYANPTAAIEGSGDGRKEAMLDGSSTTFFHSAWDYKPSNQSGDDATQAFLIDMAQEETLTKIDLLPRSNGNGAPLEFRVYVYDKDATPVDLTALTSSNVTSSLSEATLGAPTLSGTWEDNANLKTATFTEPVKGRYILFVADVRHQATDGQWFCVAEFNAYKDASTYNITYDFYIDDTKVGSSNPIVVEAGAAYPNIQLPSTMTCSADYYTLSAKPAGTVTADETVNITITQNTPFSISDSYANAKWYTIANHTNGYYLNYVSGSSSMTLNRTTTEYADEDLFCFLGNVVEGFKIYNKAAGDGYILSSAKSTFDGKTGGSTYAIMTPTATAEQQSYLWDVTKSSNIEGGFYIGQHNNNSGKNRLNRRDGKLAYWNSGADAGSSFVVSRVYGSAAYTLLYNTIESASAVIGTAPGYFPQSAVDAATLVLNDPNSSDADYEQAKNTLDAAMIMPENGKTYQLISANPAFEQKQGHKKAIYDNGTQMRWGQLNAESRSFYWTFTASDDKYILQNVGTERYPGVQTAQNVAVPSQEGSNTVTLAPLGSAQFNITATGCGAAMHTMGHNAGAGTENFICIWDAGVDSGSAWYIVEAEAPAVDLVALEAAIATAESYQGHIGTGLGQYQGLTEETLASDITTAQGFLTSTNQEEVDAATAALNTEIGKLSLNMPTAGQYMRIKGETSGKYIGNGLSSNKYTRTTDEAEALVYFDGTTLRNVSNGGYYSSSANTWSWAEKANAKTIEFSSTQIGKYIVKCGDRYLYDADSNVDSGTSLPATTHAQYPRYTSWILESAEASAANMRISDAGWATFWAPFAVEIPEGVKAYTGELVDNSWVRMIELDGVIPANAGVVVAGEEFNADLAPVEPQPNLAAESCYTGNTTGKVMNVPAGVYLLQKQDDVVGWYKVDGEGFTLAPNRCYLNVPDPNNSRPFIGFEPVDDATGISSIATEAKTKADGKYMVKGQIVVVKSGKAYNMSGTEIK